MNFKLICCYYGLFYDLWFVELRLQLSVMEYDFMENNMGIQQGYDPSSMYNVGFDSEFIHVSLFTLSTVCLDTLQPRYNAHSGSQAK